MNPANNSPNAWALLEALLSSNTWSRESKSSGDQIFPSNPGREKNIQFFMGSSSWPLMNAGLMPKRISLPWMTLSLLIRRQARRRRLWRYCDGRRSEWHFKTCKPQNPLIIYLSLEIPTGQHITEKGGGVKSTHMKRIHDDTHYLGYISTCAVLSESTRFILLSNYK